MSVIFNAAIVFFLLISIKFIVYNSAYRAFFAHTEAVKGQVGSISPQICINYSGHLGAVQQAVKQNTDMGIISL